MLATFRLVVFAFLIVVILALQGVFASSAIAQASQVTVEVKPTSVELPSTKVGEEAVVVVRNPTTDILKNVRLIAFSNAGVETVPQRNPDADRFTEIDQLAPMGEHTWKLLVKETDDGPISGMVHLRVKYDRVVQDETTDSGIREVPQTVLTDLQINTREPSTVEEAVDVEVKMPSGTLNRYRPGKAFLIVKNKSDVPADMIDLSLKGPTNMKGPRKIVSFECVKSDFITRKCRIRGGSVPLDPNHKRSIAIEIEPAKRVTPGKYFLLYDIGFQWGSPGAERQGDWVGTTGEVQVEVFGESFLQLIGVPLLFALPGFLALGAWNILSKLYPLKPKGRVPTLPQFITDFGSQTVRSFEFWIATLTISGFVVFFYSIVRNINFLQSYGWNDIVTIWIVGLLLGAITYVFFRGAVSWYKGRRIPSEADSPIRLLEKLGKQELGIKLDRAKVELNGMTFRLFLLEPKREDQEEIWVGPYIVVEWKEEERSERAEEEYLQLRKQVRECLKSQGDPKRLANLLKRGKRSHSLCVRWGSSKGPGRPRLVQKTAVKEDWSVEPDIIIVTN